MLDADRDVSERGLGAVSEADELRRPRKVVLDDLDGITHRAHHPNRESAALGRS